MIKIQHTHGVTETHATIDDAHAALRAVYGDEIEIEADDDLEHGRALVWSDAASAENDDGARAVASYRVVREEIDPCAP